MALSFCLVEKEKMEPTDFPPNSAASRTGRSKPQVQQIVSGEARTNKRSFRRQIKETFLGGDLRSAFSSAMWDIFIPETRDMIYSVFTGGLERLFFGEGRRRGAFRAPQGEFGRMRYDNMYGPSSGLLQGPARTLSKEARGRHDFNTIVLSSRADGHAVLDQLLEVISNYGEASVSDLYATVGIPSDHTDLGWGWRNLRGSGVHREGDGFVLDLPKPEPLN